MIAFPMTWSLGSWEIVFPIELLKKLGGEDEFNMTLLALNLSHFVNGVAKKHGEVSSGPVSRL